ncbi:MAG: MFS transporter [Gemmatimonadota bacterium]
MAPLLVLFVTAFVDMIGLTMIVPILPYYAKNFGASASVIGLLISAFSLAQLMVAPVWGRFSDRYGRRPAILAGLLITAVAYLIFAFSGSVWLLLLSRIIQGLGGGTIGVVQAYVADASLPEQRTKSLGWLSAVTSLGAVAGPAFGSAMIRVGGQSAPGIGAAILALLVGIFAWRYLRESHEIRKSGAHAAPPVTRGRSVLVAVLVGWNNPASRLIWIYTIAIGAFYGTIQTVSLLLQKRFAITVDQAGYFIMYLGGMGAIIRALILGPMVDRLGEARLSRLGIVILALGLGFTGTARGWPMLVAGFTLMPLGTAFIFPCVTGLLSRVIPGAERGLYMGVQHTFGGASRVVFPIAAGILMDHFGIGVPFVVSAVLVLLTLPLTGAMASYLAPSRASQETLEVAAADITGEMSIETLTEVQPGLPDGTPGTGATRGL